MSKRITRRKLLATGVATAAGVSALALAARIAERYGLIPPDHQGILGIGESLTYASQRILTSHHSLAREFNRSEISKIAPVLGEPPVIETYQRLRAGDFAEWRLVVDGLVASPASFSLAELKRFPAGSQITHQACEEGWSFIAEWTGVPLSYVLNLVGALPPARYVVFTPYENDDPPNVWWESIDMADAWHPQTLL
ncbi:MAG TPA: molybdopterin-dependent oxidoreductase, partial [Candidatus Eisenbacteria bacterium]|nr:molybdopterin-dependent oxidoreductase [Candidatus Eisenbacteria bacterium]